MSGEIKSNNISFCRKWVYLTEDVTWLTCVNRSSKVNLFYFMFLQLVFLFMILIQLSNSGYSEVKYEQTLSKLVNGLLNLVPTWKQPLEIRFVMGQTGSKMWHDYFKTLSEKRHDLNNPGSSLCCRRGENIIGI